MHEKTADAPACLWLVVVTLDTPPTSPRGHFDVVARRCSSAPAPPRRIHTCYAAHKGLPSPVLQLQVEMAMVTRYLKPGGFLLY
jgi:hypothetical protein